MAVTWKKLVYDSDTVLKTLFDANTIIAADSDDTPTARTIAEQQIVGRITSGNIKGLSATEVRTLINVADGATANTKAAYTDINTGTDDVKFVTSDGFAGSNFGKRIIEVKVFDDATAVTTGDGKAIICIPESMNGMNLVQAEAYCTTVSSSGNPAIALRNVTDTTNPLSTDITIDATEFTSYTAATRSVVNATYDDVATGDRIAIDVDTAGTGTKGLGVILTFQLP